MSIQAPSLLSLDDIINDIGFGRFQFRIYIFTLLIVVNYITHVVLSGYILPAITNQWNLSLYEQSFLGCLEYFMQVVASFITSHSTPYGRKKPIIISMIIWTGSVFLTCFFNNFYAFCFFRSLTACSSLICNMVSYTLLSEVLPMNNRGKWLGSFEFFVILGHLQLILFMMATFNSLGEGNIQLFIFFLFLSLLFTCVVVVLICDESPRYLSFHNKVQECIALLDKIMQENKKDKEIYMTSEKKENFERWIKLMENEEIKKNNSEKVEFKSIFKGIYKKITITLYFVWFANCLVSAGNDYILPMTLYKVFNSDDHSENVMMMMLCINIITIPFLIPAVWATDMKIFGRKKTLTLSLLLLGISCLFIWMDIFLNIFVWLIAAKYAIAINYMILSIYTNEIYPTKLRSLGYGSSVGLGKIGSIFSPIVSVFLCATNPLLPFGFFSVISIIGGILLVNLKYDTTNEDMDRILKEDVELSLLEIKNPE